MVDVTQEMGYSHTLSRGRMGFLPREHHAPEAHRAQLEGQGGMMLEGGENPFCRGIGVRIIPRFSGSEKLKNEIKVQYANGCVNDSE